MFPPQPFGFVAGKWVLSKGDTTADEDREPDYTPVTEGTLTFTPVLPHRTVEDPTDYPSGYAGILNTPVQGNLNARGQLIEAEGEPHLALAVGRYRVTYDFGLTSWPDHDIEVTSEHTLASPLWIPTQAPIPAGPGIVQVVNEATRLAAESAAKAAQSAALSAWEAVDTPGRQGPSINLAMDDVKTLSPGAPATAAVTGGPIDYQLALGIPQGISGEVTLSQLNAGLAAKVTGTGMTVRVDTSVGTRVLLDHPGGSTMLYGDTGSINAIPYIISGWKQWGIFPLTLRRAGSRVYLSGMIDGTEKTANAFLQPPIGYRPSYARTYPGIGINWNTNEAQKTSANTTRISADSAPAGQYNFTLEWDTADPWPTT